MTSRTFIVTSRLVGCPQRPQVGGQARRLYRRVVPTVARPRDIARRDTRPSREPTLRRLRLDPQAPGAHRRLAMDAICACVSRTTTPVAVASIVGRAKPTLRSSASTVALALAAVLAASR